MRAISLASTLAVAQGAHWAVLVAGSNGYMNYRHQADVCHAYQVVKAKGIPEENIITLAYDDIANNSENPLPGKIFNKPDPNGAGVDVYAGCKIDYKGKDVTPQNFQAVLTGSAEGKSLKSTADDEVFVFFSDHGAPGLIAFPSSELHKQDLQKTLKQMSDNKMFNKLVFYLEACESGSMWKGLDVPGVYALSASNPTESSWGTYCSGDDSTVNGKNIGSCLGDLFSVNWMEDSDAKDTTKESLDDQFSAVKKLTDKSQVMQWGDLSFKADMVSKYEGDLDSVHIPASKNPSATAVSARQVDLKRLYDKYVLASTSAERLAAGKELNLELQRQIEVESAYQRFVALAYPGDKAKQDFIWSTKSLPDEPECELAARDVFKTSDKFDSFSGFAMQFHQVIVNVCADVVATGSNVDVVQIAKRAISDESIVV